VLAPLVALAVALPALEMALGLIAVVMVVVDCGRHHHHGRRRPRRRRPRDCP